MSDVKKASRRDFLAGSMGTVAAASVAGGLSIARSAHGAANDDTLKACLIGCGGRGTGAATNFLNVPDRVKLVALADIFEDRLQNCYKQLSDGKKNKHVDKVDLPKDRLFVGLDAYQKAIDCGVDIVIMATPPGLRPPIYKAAIEAGKHVFTEKPLCTDAAGFRSLMKSNKLAEEKGLKVGVGLQRHHEPRYIETIERIQGGAIGKLSFLRAYWNMGNIWTKPREDWMNELQYQVRNWQYFFYFGGDHIVEQHVHNLDVCNWVMKGHPVEVNGMGGRQRRDEFDNMGMIYDHHFVEYTYADGTKMFSQCRQMPGCWNQVSEWAHGSEGTADCSGTISGESAWKFRGDKPNPYDQEHVDLVKAIRNDEKYHEGWHGATSTFTAVLGRMATYSGKTVTWDEAVQKGPRSAPELTSWDVEPPFKPDADGTYKSSVAMPGIFDPFA